MISHLLARNVGALAVAAAVLTSSTVAFAAAPTDNPALYLTKKKATSLVGLSPELQKRAIQVERNAAHDAWPDAATLGERYGDGSPLW